MEYGIWLSFNNQEEGFQLPVNPPSIEIGESGNGKTYDINGLGEINVIKSPKLTDIAFSSEFPSQHYPYVVSDVLFEPSYYIDLINKWRATKRPIRFVFTGSTFDINMAVSIEKFNLKESGGAVGDIEYEIAFKKYVFYSARRVTVVQSGASQSPQPAIQKQQPARPSDKVPPKRYKLIPGDTLWKVAKKELGDETKWKEIQKINNISDAQLKSLAVGMELKLPPVV